VAPDMSPLLVMPGVPRAHVIPSGMSVSFVMLARPNAMKLPAGRLTDPFDRLTADPRFGAWAVVERATGVTAGTVLLKPLPAGADEGWGCGYSEPRIAGTTSSR
jgi:hypothetical protein